MSAPAAGHTVPTDADLAVTLRDRPGALADAQMAATAAWTAARGAPCGVTVADVLWTQVKQQTAADATPTARLRVALEAAAMFKELASLSEVERLPFRDPAANDIPALNAQTLRTLAFTRPGIAVWLARLDAADAVAKADNQRRLEQAAVHWRATQAARIVDELAGLGVTLSVDMAGAILASNADRIGRHQAQLVEHKAEVIAVLRARAIAAHPLEVA